MLPIDEQSEATSDVLVDFLNKKSPDEIEPQHKVSKNAKIGVDDHPPKDNKETPLWVKTIVIFQIVAVNVLIYLIASNLPFTLSDTMLIVYAGLGLGSPIGLTNNTIRQALSNVFNVAKSGIS